MKELDESIAHWERMIEWVKTQPILDHTSTVKMRQYIDEYWDGSYCSLCKKYYKKYNHDRYVYRMDICEGCPIIPHCLSRDSLWRKVNESITWGEWISNAEILLKELKRLKGEK